MSMYSSNSRASSYYSTRPSSSLLSRTTSLERSNYTSPSSSYTPYTPYTSRYSSSTYSSASKPPRPSYSSSYSSDSYRSRIGKDSSPIRPSYSRNTSEVRDLDSDKRRDSLTSNRSSDSSSRYSSSTISSRLRDSSSTKDLGYSSSRVTSRERSLDVKNANGLDAKGYGPTSSSYASNYRWEGTSQSNGRKNDADDSDSKDNLKVSDRIRNYETPEREVKKRYNHMQATTDELARLKREEERLSARRERLGLSNLEKSRSRTPEVFSRRKPVTTEGRYNSSVAADCNGNDDSQTEEDSRPSVSSLRQKYSNCNGHMSKGSDENDNDSKDLSTPRDSPLVTRRRMDSTAKVNDSVSLRRRTDSADSSLSDSRRKNDSEGRVNDNKAKNDSESKYSESTPVAESYKSGYSSPSRYDTSVGSPSKYDTSPTSTYTRKTDRTPSLTNGTSSKALSHLDDPSCTSSPSSPSSRRDRVRERVRERLAREVEDTPTAPSPEPGFTPQGGLVGLRNIGNTCFLNSVVQCLSNTRALMEYLVHDKYQGDINTTLATMKGELVRSFAALLSEMWRAGAGAGGDSNRAVNTGPFKAQIQRFCPMFSGYQQHDAQEFLRQLLNGLDEDVNRVTVRPKAITTDIPDDLSDDQIAVESWKRSLRLSNSAISDMFVGQFKSCLACLHCSHRSVTFEPFWDLSLSIPTAPMGDAVSLLQCFDHFTENEILDADNRPKCERCGEKRRMSKSLHIARFPKVLVVHLMRFSPNERWRGKLTRHVQFPVENLDLSRYADNTSVPCNYDLVGVANHSGTTYSGHYTAFCRHPYSGDWHQYNDSRVQSINAKKVCSPEGYLLFYELKGSL